MKRVLVEEWLDGLPADDPGAQASRRDLRRINFWMGNYRWAARQVKDQARDGDECLELGAGDGCLGKYLLPERLSVRALDRAPRPASWPDGWDWDEADLWSPGVDLRADIVLGVLFLHHFSEDELARLGQVLDQSARVMIWVEPARRYHAHVLGAFMELAGIHPVTRHDMHVSIRAGFRCGELADVLGLDPGRWKIQEREDWRGSLRMVAFRE